MEWMLPLAAIASVWIIISWLRQRDEMREKTAESWQYSIDEIELDVSFREMRLTLERSAPDFDMEDLIYEMKRSPDASWWIRMSIRTYEAESNRLQKCASDRERLGSWMAAEELLELEKGRVWKPMPDTYEPSLEVAYQRYLRS